MRAALTERFGRPEEAFRIMECPEPRIGEREILVRVKAASVNPVDVKFRAGRYGCLSIRIFFQKEVQIILNRGVSVRLDLPGHIFFR